MLYVLYVITCKVELRKMQLNSALKAKSESTSKVQNASSTI